MRIVSLLPSLTELVFALGRGPDLVGVTHECDFPSAVERLPRLTSSTIPTQATSSEIDARVAEQGGSLYQLDAQLLASIEPDLILTQAQCDVCAVNEAQTRRIAASLSTDPHVESFSPVDLSSVHAMFQKVGDLLDRRSQADALIARFQERAAMIELRIGPCSRVRIVHLEWLDPPFSSGHWNPEIIDLAGGIELLGKPGQSSRRLTWDQIALADPDGLLIAPCGFDRERTEREWSNLKDRPQIARLRAVKTGRVALCDGSAFFSRPGPRLLDSLGIAADAMQAFR